MPRKQDIYAENPILQGLTAVAGKLRLAKKDIKEGWRKQATTNTLEQIGKMRADTTSRLEVQNFHSYMKGVNEINKTDPAVTSIAIDESLHPDGKGDKKFATIAAQILDDQRKRDVFNFKVAARDQFARDQMRDIIALNAGTVGMMDAGERATLEMMMSDGTAKLDGTGNSLSSIAKMMRSGKSGGAGTGATGRNYNLMPKEVTNKDGTTEMVWFDGRNGQEVSRSSWDSNKTNIFDITDEPTEGRSGLAHYQFNLKELSSMSPEDQSDYVREVLGTQMKDGWIPQETPDGEILIRGGLVQFIKQPVRKAPTGGGGGGKEKKNSYLVARKKATNAITKYRDKWATNSFKGVHRDLVINMIEQEIKRFDEATLHARANGDKTQAFWGGGKEPLSAVKRRQYAESYINPNKKSLPEPVKAHGGKTDPGNI